MFTWSLGVEPDSTANGSGYLVLRLTVTTGNTSEIVSTIHMPNDLKQFHAVELVADGTGAAFAIDGETEPAALSALSAITGPTDLSVGPSDDLGVDIDELWTYGP